jgi:hypothetical protein
MVYRGDACFSSRAASPDDAESWGQTLAGLTYILCQLSRWRAMELHHGQTFLQGVSSSKRGASAVDSADEADKAANVDDDEAPEDENNAEAGGEAHDAANDAGYAEDEEDVEASGEADDAADDAGNAEDADDVEASDGAGDAAEDSGAEDLGPVRKCPRLASSVSVPKTPKTRAQAASQVRKLRSGGRGARGVSGTVTARRKNSWYVTLPAGDSGESLTA